MRQYSSNILKQILGHSEKEPNASVWLLLPVYTIFPILSPKLQMQLKFLQGTYRWADYVLIFFNKQNSAFTVLMRSKSQRGGGW